MRVAIGDAGTALGYSSAPGPEIDLVHLAEVNVDPSLPDPAAADAWEISLAAGLERETTIHDVIPAIPLRHARGIHGADKIAQPLRNRDAYFLGADAVHLGD